MRTRTAIGTVVVPRPRESDQRRISLGIAIRVRSGALRDCTVTVNVQPLGTQQRNGKPFVVTIAPLAGWSPPPSGRIPFDGDNPIKLCATADEVEELLEADGLTWR